MRTHHAWRTLLLSILLGAAVVATSTPAAAQNCGVDSVVSLLHLLGRDASPEDEARLAGLIPGSEPSMFDIQQAAGAFGIELAGMEATLDELGSFRGPKIIHTKNPSHFLVLLRASAEWAQVVDGGKLAVGEREALEGLYSGYALVLDPGGETGGPRLEVSEFHSRCRFTGVGQKIERVFAVRNTGDEALVLRPEGKG